MMDREEGWLNGVHNLFDRQWNLTYAKLEGREVIAVGAQLTAALSFLRMHLQTGEPVYRDQGLALADRLNRSAWDRQRGCWYDMVERRPPHAPVSGASVSWWIQIYGCFLQLLLYRLTRDGECLERFRASESFYLRYFVDREHGGIFQGVSLDGTLIGDGAKAASWRASYHEMEHALLASLWLDQYVGSRPSTLHFLFDGTGTNRTRFVSFLDDPSVRIAAVKINGEGWKGFDAVERSIELPAAAGLRTEMTFSR